MEILGLLFRGIVLLIGIVFLAVGLFCGGMSLTGSGMIMLTLISLAVMAAGYFMVRFAVRSREVDGQAALPPEPPKQGD